MWIAGLRGAMAYALSLDASEKSFPGKIMLGATLIYALFTIFIVSSFLQPIMIYCEVVKVEKDADTAATLKRSLSFEDA